MTRLLGRSHALARRLRALRRDKARRDAEGVLVAEGFHLVEEAIRHAAGAVEAVVVGERFDSKDEGRRLAGILAAAGIDPRIATDEAMAGIQDARSPQPVLAIVRRTAPELARVVAGRGGTPLVVVVHELQDPGNLGALIRSADAGGATGFVVLGNAVDLYHPRAVRATMGSIFRLPAIATEAKPLFDTLRASGIRTVAADPRAVAGYDAVEWTVPVAIVLGSEGHGLPPELSERLHVRVRIPMAEGCESLSVTAAGAILVFEAARRRRDGVESATGG